MSLVETFKLKRQKPMPSELKPPSFAAFILVPTDFLWVAPRSHSLNIFNPMVKKIYKITRTHLILWSGKHYCPKKTRLNNNSDKKVSFSKEQPVHVQHSWFLTTKLGNQMLTLSAEAVKNKSPLATNFRLVTYQMQFLISQQIFMTGQQQLNNRIKILTFLEWPLSVDKICPDGRSKSTAFVSSPPVAIMS